MYNPASVHADDFINHEEILETLSEAAVQSKNPARVEEILAKAARCKGLTHREAAILLDCDDPVLEEKIYALAREIKEKFYGNRIVLFAPLYLSNYCINGCVYCPYHAKNRTSPRKKLSQEEIEAEVRALIQSHGGSVLAIEPCGEAKHVFTHVEWHMRGCRVHISEELPDLLWKTPEEIRRDCPIPTALRYYEKKL